MKEAPYEQEISCSVAHAFNSNMLEEVNCGMSHQSHSVLDK